RSIGEVGCAKEQDRRAAFLWRAERGRNRRGRQSIDRYRQARLAARETLAPSRAGRWEAMTDAERRQRIDELCDAALDRRIEERAAFIATACKEDYALRREVESLLAHAPMVDEFLATTATAVAAEMFASDHESLVGRQLGPYSVVAFIGAGG